MKVSDEVNEAVINQRKRVLEETIATIQLNIRIFERSVKEFGTDADKEALKVEQIKLARLELAYAVCNGE